MKTEIRIWAFALLATVQLSFGQGPVGVDNGVTQLVNSIDQMSTGKRQIVSAYVKNPPRKVFGSYHIFKDWNTKGIVHVKGDKAYRINDVNVNVREDRFEARAGKDSIFSFDAHSVDFFIINDRKFKEIYLNKFQEKRICEVVVEDDSFMILKIYRTDIKKNDPDPLMLKPDGDEFVINSGYYLKRGESLEKFKLNKKQILDLFPDRAKLIDSYVKEQKLSYKKSEHLKNIYHKWKTLLN